MSLTYRQLLDAVKHARDLEIQLSEAQQALSQMDLVRSRRRLFMDQRELQADAEAYDNAEALCRSIEKELDKEIPDGN